MKHHAAAAHQLDGARRVHEIGNVVFELFEIGAVDVIGRMDRYGDVCFLSFRADEPCLFCTDRYAVPRGVLVGVEPLRGDPGGRLFAALIALVVKSLAVACRAKVNHIVFLLTVCLSRLNRPYARSSFFLSLPSAFFSIRLT